MVLVEDASGILLRIGMDEDSKSGGRDVQVRILIGAGVGSWSTLADYPRRVPLHHCDSLVHYTAAQSVSPLRRHCTTIRRLLLARTNKYK